MRSSFSSCWGRFLLGTIQSGLHSYCDSMETPHGYRRCVSGDMLLAVIRRGKNSSLPDVLTLAESFSKAKWQHNKHKQVTVNKIDIYRTIIIIMQAFTKRIFPMVTMRWDGNSREETMQVNRILFRTCQSTPFPSCFKATKWCPQNVQICARSTLSLTFHLMGLYDEEDGVNSTKHYSTGMYT